MLKTIIQEKNVDGLLRFEPAPLGEAVSANTKRHAILEAKFHQLDFITGSVYAAVATTQYRNLFPFREKLLSEPDYHRRLPRASDGKIPHADDPSFQPLLLQPTVCVKPDAHADAGTIQDRKRPKKRSQQRPSVHRPAPSRRAAISATARSVAPRESVTNWRAVSPIFFMRSGLRNSSIQATPASSGLST